MLRSLLILAICASTSAALAESAHAAETPALSGAGREPSRGRLEFVTAISAREGQFEGGFLPVKYGGVALASARLSAVTFPFGPTWGLGADFGFERFRVLGVDLKGNAFDARLNAFQLFPSVTGQWRPFSAIQGLGVEAQLGYGFGAFPVLTSQTGEVTQSAVGYSGPQLGAAVSFELGATSARLRATALPFAFTRSSPLAPELVRTLALGAQVAWGAFPIGAFMTAVVLDYEATSAQALLPGGNDVGARLNAHRFGVGLRATLPGGTTVVRRVPSGPARIHGTLLLADSKQPAAGAQLEVAGEAPITVGADGRFTLEDVKPGQTKVRVTLAGYAPLEKQVSLVAEQELQLPLLLERLTGPGALRGAVRLRVSATESLPAPEVRVQVPGGPSVLTALDGSFILPDVGPGPVPLVIEAKGYKRLEEVASVPPGGEATLELALERIAAQALASMRGRVRSTRGRNVKAMLVVPEAKIRTGTKADGSFHVRLPGGRYTVVFEAEGFVTQTRVVDVGSGDQALFYVDLSPKEP